MSAVEALRHDGRHRSAKIVATLSPSSASKEVIRALYAAGVHASRLNSAAFDTPGATNLLRIAQV